jgi:hypothetical protein
VSALVVHPQHVDVAARQNPCLRSLTFSNHATTLQVGSQAMSPAVTGQLFVALLESMHNTHTPCVAQHRATCTTASAGDHVALAAHMLARGGGVLVGGA